MLSSTISFPWYYIIFLFDEGDSMVNIMLGPDLANSSPVNEPGHKFCHKSWPQSIHYKDLLSSPDWSIDIVHEFYAWNIMSKHVWTWFRSQLWQTGRKGLHSPHPIRQMHATIPIQVRTNDLYTRMWQGATQTTLNSLSEFPICFVAGSFYALRVQRPIPN